MAQPPTRPPAQTAAQALAQSLLQPKAQPQAKAQPKPVPAAPKGQPQMQSTADGQTCQKCGAVFHWERLDKTNPKSPLRLKLDTGSKRCDCGYGKGRG